MLRNVERASELQASALRGGVPDGSTYLAAVDGLPGDIPADTQAAIEELFDFVVTFAPMDYTLRQRLENGRLHWRDADEGP